MLREKMVSLLNKSIRNYLALSQYNAAVYYKMKIADNYMEGGLIRVVDNIPDINYIISYPDSLEFFEIYNAALLTKERFNNIEIYFNNEEEENVIFIWDQHFYDEDVRGNQKLKSRRKWKK
jgi:hypothetical protein